MPLIEVLPNSTNTSAPGWAYVPDTGYDPSKAPIQPSGARQRAARANTFGDGQEMSAKQNNAVVKRLEELDKDNHRDLHIPVPIKQKDGAGRASRGKVMPGVRRILQSQKTFANHLADEEAQIALQGQSALAQPPPTPQRPVKITKPPSSRGKRRISADLDSSLQRDRSSSSAAVVNTPLHPLLVAHSPSVPSALSTGEQDPLLKSYTPPRPSDAFLEELQRIPPLSYAAARSKPSSLGLPQRRFCEICGYWGRARCMKCGARFCGLECKEVHDEQRCLRFYA